MKAQTKRRRDAEANARPVAMSSAESLDGLATFLSVKGNSLLIKGYAGSGKTTLALQLLRQLSKDGKGAYVSSRISQQKLARQQPPLIRKGGQSKPSYDFLDIRLGTGQSVLQEVMGMARPGKAVKTIVLDTWDGLAKEMEVRERLKAEKMLVSFADSKRIRMIFVSEEPRRTTMDYLVDGIIELVRSEQFDRVFREVEVQKLRGTLIDQHKYLYTLLEGKFAHFPAYRPPNYEKTKRLDPIPDYQRPDGVYYSFGSGSIDAALGGIKKGSVFALEFGEKVPYSAIRMIELGAVVNFLNTGRSVALTPLPGANESDIESLVNPLVSKEARSRNFVATGGAASVVKTASQVSAKKHGLSGAVVGTDRPDADEVEPQSVRHLKENSVDGSVLYVVSLSMSENALASDLGHLLEALSLRVSTIQQRGSSDAMLLFLQSDSQIRSSVLSMSYRNARLFEMDRTVVLLGEKPSTEAYVLEHDDEHPLLPCLTRIV